MSSDVFIIAADSTTDPAEAIRIAVEHAGVSAPKIQDSVFGMDKPSTNTNVVEIMRKAGLACGTVIVSPSLRAIFFAGQSVLSGDIDLVVVPGLNTPTTAALVMASAEAVGRLNLFPRARLAARSLAGLDLALRAAEIEGSDIAIFKKGGDSIALVKELIEELELQQAKWGAVTEGESVLIVERV